jgi:predicted  nucleic acid-binding Zn-ribbon protein
MLPACPKCGSVDYRTEKTTSQGDGSRRVIAGCINCGAGYAIVWEPPTEHGEEKITTLVQK